LEKAVNRSEKAEAIVELNQIFKDANLMVVTRQSGLTVQEVTDLRRKVRAAGASYKVAKNRLTLRALEGTSSRRSVPTSRARLPLPTPRIRSLRRRSSRPSPRTTRS
jgi:ribosomal protein L10